MITYRNANINDLEMMCLLFNEVVNLDGFYKPFSVDEYKNKMLTDPNFSLDNVYLALSGKMLVSFMIVVVRPSNSDTAYINALVTKKEYRNQGIASNLLDQVEKDFLARGFKTLVATNFLPSCYAWYIPNTDKHDHPCAPGISINSSLYFFYLHHRFDAISYQDAFHLNLSSYKYSDKINEIIERKEDLNRIADCDFTKAVQREEQGQAFTEVANQALTTTEMGSQLNYMIKISTTD